MADERRVPLTGFGDTFKVDEAGAPIASPEFYKDDCFSNWDVSRHEYQPGYPFDFYEPRDDIRKKRACVMLLHGGGGDIESMKDWAVYLALKGYAAPSVEFKLDTGNYTLQKQIAAAVNIWNFIDYIRANDATFRVKETKIIIGGSSAGAITALQAALWWNNRTDLMFEDMPVPDSNKLRILATFTLSGATSVQDLIDIIEGDEGEQFIDPPNAYYHGMDDDTVPYDFAVKSYEKQVSLGIKSKFTAFKGKDHNMESGDYIKPDVVNWLYLVLKGKTPEPLFIEIPPS